MQFNPLGVIAAASLFFSIWFGHVAVRRIEFLSPILWLPGICFAASGLALEYFATRVDSPSWSVALGILGITLLWDALELFRQQRRVCRGHAPANPGNPRHVRILAAHPCATTVDLLKQDSSGGLS
jgi:hypothetical protein